ncbi:MAG: TMEM43 family protein [Bacilli bacterium]|nr:TMEM43 family protein [Bacilli bacterium]
MKKGNSIVGGLIFLILGICLLWWNEGNNVKNIQSVSEGEKNYTDITSSTIDAKYDGKLVATSGNISVTGSVFDDVFGVSSDSAALYRKVEMYQWKEECESDNNCSYKKEWSEDLIDSADFNKAEYVNPDTKLYESEKFLSDNVMVGAFNLPDKLIDRLSTNKKLKDLKEEIASSHGMVLTSNNYYTNVQDNSPQVGDIRISFYENDAKVVSVLAEQSDNTFKVYKTKKGKDLFRIFEDNYDGADMLSIIAKQNKMMKWIFRIAGILAIMIGIGSIFSPLTLLLGKVPILGSIVNGATGVASFVLGLSISLVVIAIAWFRFRPLLSIVLIIVVIGLIVGLKIYSKNQKIDNNSNEQIK